ncbi:hypothetical protein [Roseobacter sp. HKCCD5988]|uniref:hypothetical protein n=1 Tax=Roseobacter sp. HKCCD5988 TaxID=3120338 RepID=UPI0030EE242A
MAIFDYAHYNEEILNNKSYIIAPSRDDHDLRVVRKYLSRFKLFFYDDEISFQKILRDNRADYFYAIKSGHDDGLRAAQAQNLVHAVFPGFEAHGDKFACISNWLANTSPDIQFPAVPHIINTPKASGDFRKFFQIPDTATVYGSMGGEASFDVPFAAKEIIRIAESSSDKFFLFLGTKIKFLNPIWKLRLFIQVLRGRLIFISPRINKSFKVRFINTCNAMISARRLGESFGLAIGEFSALGKPIILFSHSSVRDRAHIEQLGADGNYYTDSASLRQLLQTCVLDLKTSTKYKRKYSPERVMAMFDSVFLKNDN